MKPAMATNMLARVRGKKNDTAEKIVETTREKLLIFRDDYKK